MGKMKRYTSKKVLKPYPLDKDINENKFAKKSTRIKIENRQEDTEKFVDARSTRNILLQARQQQEDLEEEIGLNGFCKRPDIQLSEIKGDVAQCVEEDDYLEELKLIGEDKMIMECFLPKDLIKEKLIEKKTEIQTIFSDAGGMNPETLETFTRIFEKVGQHLSTYRSGKIPKQFKFLPRLPNWEQILYITQPDKWTAAAMYGATRIFASNLKDNMVVRFYKFILLPRLRDDIAECKRLNFHLYAALKKAGYKPSAFFRGIIIPLCESESCTLREATIIASVLPKISIPIIHSSAALFHIAEMDFTGSRSIFMRTLLEKNYALPFKVIDIVVTHFLRCKEAKMDLPVLWHQCLKTFVEKYKTNLSIEQKRELLCLLKTQTHSAITPVIRREITTNEGQSIEALIHVKDT